MEQTSLWDFICERFICKRELAVIEAFAGYGSQLKALRYLQDFFGKDVIKYHHKLIIEWALNSIIAYADLHQDELPNYGIDYSKDLKKEEIAELLHKLGVSINYNKPAELPQLKRVNEDRLRLCYNSIIWSNNLVDISRVKGNDLNIDNSKEDVLFCWSFPCQDLSLAGTMSNLKKEHEINDDNIYDDGNRSNMIWQVVRILRECAELGYDHLPTIMMMENVTQIHSMDNIGTFNDVKRILEDLGYLCWDKDLSGVDFGIPQTRNRTFMICILKGKDGIEYNYKFPKKIPLKLKLKDLLESNVDEKYYLSQKMIEYVSATGGGGLGTTTPKSIKKLQDHSQQNKTKELEQQTTFQVIFPNEFDLQSIKIKNATQKGYLEASEGDGIDISSRMESHRGTVQKDKAQTITTMGGENVGVIVKEHIPNYTEKSLGKIKNNIVKDDVSGCITATGMQSINRDGCQLVEEVVSNKVVKVGNYSPSGHNASSIVDVGGVAPTVMENHGTVTAIMEDEKRR